MSEHTPGPWRVHRPTTTETLVTGNRGRQVVAAVVNRVDADLIAESPNLLKRLEEVEVFLDEQIQMIRRAEHISTPEMRDRVRAAIAKAKG